MKIYLKQMVQLRKQLLIVSKEGDKMKKGSVVRYESGYAVFSGIVEEISKTGNMIVRTALDDLIFLSPNDILIKGGDGESQDSSLAEGTGNK